jgi:hypothetical protein
MSGLINAFSQGMSSAGYAGGDLYAKQALEDQRSQAEQAKAIALAKFSNQLANEPLNRLSAKAKEYAAQEVPQEAAPVTKASGNDPQLLNGGYVGPADQKPTQGMTGTYESLVERAKNLSPDDQQSYLDQLKRQFGADKATAQSQIAGMTRPRTSDEALMAALNDAKVNDPQAYAAGKSMAQDKYINIPDGGTLFDSTSGKAVFSGTGKFDRENAKDDRRDARLDQVEAGRDARQQALLQQQARFKQQELDPLGLNSGANAAGAVDGAGDSGGSGVPASKSAAQAIAAGMNGDDLLKSIPKNLGDQVKALAEGRMAFPAGFALKSPYWQSMMTLVSQYDPSFDAVNYGTRAATRKDFTSGKASQSVNALNTVLGHLDSLGTSADALNNTSVPLWNSVANSVESGSGDPRVKVFDATKKAVVDELTRAWRGSGGSEGDIKTWSATLDASNSPKQLHGVIAQLGELLESKISSLNDQYTKGMGTTAGGLKLLSPHAEQVLKSIRARAGIESSDASANAADGQLPIVSNEIDLSHLPSGSLFKSPDGSVRRKP